MVKAYKCPGCGMRTFKLKEDEFDMHCKRCIAKLSQGGTQYDGTRNTEPEQFGQVLANNVETVADIWSDPELQPATERGTTLSPDSTDDGVQRGKETDDTQL